MRKYKKARRKWESTAQGRAFLAWFNTRYETRYRDCRGALKEVEARLREGYTLEELMQVARNKENNKYLVENGHFNLTTLYRKTHIEKYLNNDRVRVPYKAPNSQVGVYREFTNKGDDKSKGLTRSGFAMVIERLNAMEGLPHKIDTLEHYWEIAIRKPLEDIDLKAGLENLLKQHKDARKEPIPQILQYASESYFYRAQQGKKVEALISSVARKTSPSVPENEMTLRDSMNMLKQQKE